MTKKPRLTMFKSSLRTIDHRTVKTVEKRRDEFYASREWRALMDRIIKVRGRRCEECGRTGTRIFGDHIVEIRDGGAQFDETNIKCLCGSCHTKKTLAVRADRMRERY